MIIAIVFISLNQMYSVCSRSLKKTESQDIAADIAENLREEILSKSLISDFIDAPKKNNTGRLNFRTVFDYDNYTSVPPENILGDKIQEYKDYTVKITVKKIKIDKTGGWKYAADDKIRYCCAEVVISILKNNSPIIELPFIKAE